MSVAFIAVTMSNGSLTIMQFVTQFGEHERAPTPENIESELTRAGRSGDGSWRDGFPAVSWRIIAPADLPTDRRFRAAWTDNGAEIVVNLDKAREVRLRELRSARAERLEALDIEWVKALGAGRAAEAKTIEARRQALRDAPTTLAVALAAAGSVADLDALQLPS